MDEPIVYDKAKYHYDGDFPEELPMEQGFVHTGMFLGWLIDHDLCSETFKQEIAGYISAFKAREMTGAKVFEACDGVLMDEMLNEEGNAFTKYYFEFKSGKFLSDYEELLAAGLPTVYHVEDSWNNYEELNRQIDKRYRAWKRRTFWRRLLGK